MSAPGRAAQGSAAAAAAGGILLLIGGPQEGRDGEIDLTAAGSGAGQVGQVQVGEQAVGSGPVVLGGVAAAAIPVVTTHNEVPPIKIVAYSHRQSFGHSNDN